VAGKIVPSEITAGLLWAEMQRLAGTHHNFLIDGFPRNKENVDAWETVVGISAAVHFMLFFECPLPVLEERILGRAEYTQRADDNVESLRKRFTTYKDETLPVVELFRGREQCIEVDSSQPREAVYSLVKNHLAGLSDPALGSAPLEEKSECLLGLRAWPKRVKPSG
jgi:adenylate kinase family enzyme